MSAEQQQTEMHDQQHPEASASTENSRGFQAHGFKAAGCGQKINHQTVDMIAEFGQHDGVGQQK